MGINTATERDRKRVKEGKGRENPERNLNKPINESSTKPQTSSYSQSQTQLLFFLPLFLFLYLPPLLFFYFYLLACLADTKLKTSPSALIKLAKETTSKKRDRKINTERERERVTE